MAIKTRTSAARRPEPRAFNKPQPPPSVDLSERFRTYLRLGHLSVYEFIRRAAWLCFLGVLYVFFQNRFDSLTYRTDQAKSTMNEKRALYIHRKESYSLQSKQSEIAKRLNYRGLDKSITPPIKIEVADE